MKALHICAQCSRALRCNVGAATSYKLFSTTRSLQQLRLLSMSRPSRQDTTRVSDPTPHTQPPPTTAGTVTTNVTAREPSSSPTQSSSTNTASTLNVSTAQMQKQISSSLARGSGPSITQTLAQKLRQTAKSTTESYITYGLTEAFFKSCANQAPYTIPEDQRTKILTEGGPPKTSEGEELGIPESQTWWFKELGLQPTFSTWSQVAYLHMYLLTVKLRALQNQSAFTNYQRYLIEHFSNAAEDKMQILHSLNARGIRNKYLKDLFLQWRGVLAAYDEGLAKGDAVLGAAVWRNLFKGKEDVDWERVAMVVVYMRRVISKLDQVSMEDLVHNLDAGIGVWEYGRQGVKSIADERNPSIDQVMAD